MTSTLQQSLFVQCSEGRWPRICELPGTAGETRVAMLCYHTSPLAALGKSRDAGGMNVYVRELAQHLAHRGISVDIFTRWTDPTLPQIVPLSPHARLIHIPAGPIAPLPKDELFAHVPQFIAGVDCFAVSQHIDYQIIHSHYWLSGVAGLSLARRWGAPHVAMFHTLARLKQHARPEEQESPLRIEYERHVIAEADSIVVATADELRQITALYGAPAGTVHIIPGGVDLNAFTPQDRPAARAMVTRALDLDDNPIILFVGRLDPLKGPDLLVRALAQMQTPATLVLVGGDESDPERARLIALARESGVGARVRMVNAVAHESLPMYYRAADILAVASYYESFGLVAVEALASGTPVIAPSVGGLPAIIKDGVNGALVCRRTPAAFAERLDTMLSDVPALNRLRAAARPSIRHLSWPFIAAQVSAIYAKVEALQPALAAG
jgi:D-inositol-3-phosphate glycosyltransferase